MNKIVLGSAQFGINYGINNQRGQIPRTEVFGILNKAVAFKIDTVDTAYAYGESEKILGDFIKFYSNKLKVISKLPKCKYNEVEEILNTSLERLNINSVYGYLIHDFTSYKENPGVWDKLEDLKGKGKIEKIGFSFYFPSEFESVMKQGLKIDLAQFPFSIFDQRFQSYFPEFKKRKIESYARSIFLQGLAFKKSSELNSYFSSIRYKIEKLNLLSRESGIPIYALCLNFIVRNEFIDRIIVGVDNIAQFIEIARALDFLPHVNKVIQQLFDLRIDNEEIILPFNWILDRAIVQ